MTMVPTQTKPMQRSWLGRAGIEFTLHFDSSRTGKRVVVIFWPDTDELEVRAIKSDGRTTSFTEFEATTVKASSADWQARGTNIAHVMADRHFAGANP